MTFSVHSAVSVKTKNVSFHLRKHKNPSTPMHCSFKIQLMNFCVNAFEKVNVSVLCLVRWPCMQVLLQNILITVIHLN
jgi:hypothetical protein